MGVGPHDRQNNAISREHSPPRRRGAARDPPALPRRDDQRRGRRRGRAAAGVLDEMEVEPGDTLFGLYRARRCPSAAGATATRCPIASRSTSSPIDEACEDEDEIRDCVARNGHPRVRPLLRHERGRDRGDRGEVLARRVRWTMRCREPGVRRARKRFGQHFLEPAWADKVVAGDRAAAGRSLSRDRPGAGRADAAGWRPASRT